jgi:hypothetical protein
MAVVEQQLFIDHNPINWRYLMTYTLDTTLGEILDHPQAKAILDEKLPGVSGHPMVSMARGMSLKMILGFPQAAQLGLTQERAEAVLAEINKRV